MYLEERLKCATETTEELVGEAVVRASEAKSAEAVKRIAKLLTNVLVTKETIQTEEVRAMLATAGSLLDVDARTLGRMNEIQSSMLNARGGKIEFNEAVESWRKLRNSYPEVFDAPGINASGSRLQSHGLAMRVETTGSSSFGLETWVFSMTDFGVRFCRWCLVGIN
jgi:hypothetical protein